MGLIAGRKGDEYSAGLLRIYEGFGEDCGARILLEAKLIFEQDLSSTEPNAWTWAKNLAQELTLKPDPKIIATVLSSDFAFDLLSANPDWIETLTTPPEYPLVASASGLVEYRVRRSIAQIALECSGAISVEESLGYASDTAKRCIAAALELAEVETAARFGTARDTTGAPVRLCVFAMGKLGGHELNYSSDIDLILSYASAGESDGGLAAPNSARVLDNSEYFARITRRMAQLLTERTPLGSCYRVDLRLRPFGSAGQAALSFAAMEDYYQREGRDWERYAWIKARPIAGDLAGGERLREILRPFIYRRYLDFAAFEGMREMKAMVDHEVRKADLGDNLKLGPGGIREIEFLIQLEQLIRGGRDEKLRVSGSLAALSALAHAGWLAFEDVQTLRADYLFLRRVENRVQMLADQQTHSLPSTDSPSDIATRARIAASLGFASSAEFLTALQQVRQRVHKRFGEAISLPRQPVNSNLSTHSNAEAVVQSVDEAHAQAAATWQMLTGPNRDALSISAKPAAISLELWQALIGFADSSAVQSSSARGRSRMDKVVPMLWALALKQPHSSAKIEACALRLIAFLQAIAGRSAYIALLAEKPAVAERLVQLFTQSAWVAQLITSTPMLMDELLDTRRLTLPHDLISLQREADMELSSADSEDIEHAFELLIAFKHSVQLRLAVGFLQNRVDALSAVNGLSDLADVLIERVLGFAWRGLVRVHGFPAACAGSNVGFAVIGYGSLGGAELNFASDLDLVFVYDEACAQSETTGPKILDGQRFFVKLAQRVISLLTTPTRFGALYAIDTRLRPNGNKGLLVTSLSAFGDYQLREAWLWEHQALLRARWVAGDTTLAETFARLRDQTLALPRDPKQVQKEVQAMRERMRAELDRSNEHLFDLKQGQGGLVDIEFSLQAAVLSSRDHKRWSTRTHELLPELFGQDNTILANMPLDAEHRHRKLLALGLRATLELKPRIVARDVIRLS